LVDSQFVGLEVVGVVEGNLGLVLKEDLFSVGVFEGRFVFDSVLSFPGFEFGDGFGLFNLGEENSGSGEDSQKEGDLF
jgi:hypothetical protein